MSEARIKENPGVFSILNFFEQWKICCLNWNFLLKMESLVSIENRIRHHFVSIKFNQFEMDSIIAPTMAFTFYLPRHKFLLWSRLCCQFDDHKSWLERYNHVFHYPNGLEKSFRYKNRFLNNKIFIVKKTKTCESSFIKIAII